MTRLYRIIEATDALTAIAFDIKYSEQPPRIDPRRVRRLLRTMSNKSIGNRVWRAWLRNTRKSRNKYWA